MWTWGHVSSCHDDSVGLQECLGPKIAQARKGAFLVHLSMAASLARCAHGRRDQNLEACMSISLLNHRSAVLFVGALSALTACEKREKPTSRTPTENSPVGATANPELRSGTLAPTAEHTATNVEPKDPLKVADADMRKVIVELGGLGWKPVSTLSVEQARKQPTLNDAIVSLLKKEGKGAPPPLEMAKVEDKKIPGPGGSLALRIYTPKRENKDKTPVPVVVYYHGGGWVIGDVNAYDSSARALAKGAEAIVVSADYRRAPEQKFPAAHDDAYAAYEWVLKNASSFGGDPKRVAVAGESAGGNLAANVAIMARDKNVPQPVHQLLIYPVAQASMDTRSYKEWADAKPLDRASMSWFFDNALRSPEDKSDPRISLVNASLKGAAPATLILAEIDPLFSDGDMLYHALDKAGVKVEKKTYDGVSHEFFGLSSYVGDARNAEAYAGDRLKSAFKQ